MSRSESMSLAAAMSTFHGLSCILIRLLFLVSKVPACGGNSSSSFIEASCFFNFELAAERLENIAESRFLIPDSFLGESADSGGPDKDERNLDFGTVLALDEELGLS
jgi:hypothetical protein